MQSPLRRYCRRKGNEIRNLIEQLLELFVFWLCWERGESRFNGWKGNRVMEAQVQCSSRGPPSVTGQLA